jgi:tetratricopeptide (TPR) repeat protein
MFDLERSESEFKKALAINTDFIQPQIHLGQIALYRGNLAQAMEYFTKAYNRAAKELSDHAGSNEGDTAEGRSLERQINQSLFQPFFTDLAHLPGKNLSEEMLSLFKSIDVFL